MGSTVLNLLICVRSGEGLSSLSRSSLIWQIKIPPKVHFFTWLAVQGKCLTADNLAKKGWPHKPLCPLCRLGWESDSHLFTSCPFAAGVWGFCLTKFSFPFQIMPTNSTQSFLEWWISSLHQTSTSRRGFNHDHLLAYLEREKQQVFSMARCRTSCKSVMAFWMS